MLTANMCQSDLRELVGANCDGPNRYFPALSHNGGLGDAMAASRPTTSVGLRGRAVRPYPSGSRRPFARVLRIKYEISLFLDLFSLPYSNWPTTNFARRLTGRKPSGRTSFSAKLVNGMVQRLSTPSPELRFDTAGASGFRTPPR